MSSAMSPFDWLLEDDAPGVQYLARMRLLGEGPATRRMKSLRKRCNEYPPAAKMLAHVDECIAQGNKKGKGWESRHNYHKYCGAYWTLIFLAEMFADRRDPRVRRLANHVLNVQLENGGFSPSGTASYEIVCLTANLLRSLVHFGYGDDERVIRGYERLAERILPHGGVPCIVLQHCLHTSCKMSLPQTLRALAIAPEQAPKKDMKKLRELLSQQLFGVRVYQYVRPDVKEYHQALERRPGGISQREFRERWIEKHKFDDDELLPKPGWKRFGFPRSYNPDMLEAMLSLAEVGAESDPVLDDPLDYIESKRLKDGRWKLDDSLNGKMLADIERKGQPSKWITLRALTVLTHFGRVRL